jgi:hypothetical protein
MRRLSPVSVSEARGNGVVWLTRYAAPVFRWLAIVVALAACRDPDIQRLIAVKDKVCDCKTVTCAEQELKAVPTVPSTHRTQAIAHDMLGCLAKIHTAERLAAEPEEGDEEEGDEDDHGGHDHGAHEPGAHEPGAGTGGAPARPGSAPAKPGAGGAAAKPGTGTAKPGTAPAKPGTGTVPAKP